MAGNRLGQQIAFQLQINYFDEFNTSEHHVIRHYRPSKSTAGSNTPTSLRPKALSEVLWNRDEKAGK
ncbi:hypothetical protein HMI55_001918 [Coelomomyces lativittatus]|nr:hypothetical protein HMI55_001918 [Coelomomyces lativittatus]